MLVDENGKQTITNDGATVMKVRNLLWNVESYCADFRNSFSTSYIQPPEYSQTLPAHKMPKWEMALHQSLFSLEKCSRRSRSTLSRV